MTTEMEIWTFCTRVFGPQRLEKMGMKLAEECGEVCGAINKIPEGRATDSDLDDELGDALIVLSKIAATRSKTIEQLRADRWAKIKLRHAGK